MEQGAALAATTVDGRGAESTLDAESCAWLRDLRAEGADRDAAVARLHALLLRAARFETGRRRASHSHLRGDLDDIAQEAAEDALLAVLSRLDDFPGLSRFTTWAYKFALYQASVKVRRRAWQGQEVPVEDGAPRGARQPARVRPRRSARLATDCAVRRSPSSCGTR